MNFLRASAFQLVIVIAGLCQVPVALSTTLTSRMLQQNFNYEEIEAETMLSSTAKNQPVTFTATFTNLWTEARHPFGFPSSNGHWSPMVFASHSDAYSMWCEDCIATDGVEFIAETGGTSTLINEISVEQRKNNVLDQKTASGSGIPVDFEEESSTNGRLCVDEDHSLVSAISMIAPSPDWISGLYNLRLFRENSNGDDMWYSKFKVNVYAWDAGTEEGNAYSGGNPATNPKEGMTPFMAGNMDEVFVSENGAQILPVGIITFEIGENTPECTPADSTTMFVVRVRSEGAFTLRSTNCEEWVTSPDRKSVV